MELALHFFDPFSASGNGLWLFLSVGAVALFAIFLPLVTWSENRRKEREAFYKADALRRLAEAPAESSRMALEMMRVEDRRRFIKQREGIKLGGLVNVGVGVGLAIMLYSMGLKEVFLVGAIPGMIGVAMLVYVYLMAPPME
jgi:hypothetical protein